MKVYSTKDIRNVAVLGHGSCGKTTVVAEERFYLTSETNLGVNACPPLHELP